MLTDTKLRKLNGTKRDKRVELADSSGLSVRITPAGVIIFQYRYRFNEKPRRMTLGRYGEITLKDAREQLLHAKKILSQGRDPIMVRDMKLKERSESMSVSDCMSEWLLSTHAQNLVKLKYWERALERHVISQVGKMIVDEMTVSHWQPVFKKMRDNGAETFSCMVLSKLKQIFSYCIRIEKIKRNPLSELRGIDVGIPIRLGKRYFNDDEISNFWLSVDESSLAYQNKILVKLILLTGCRGVEMRLAKKCEFDFDKQVWRVPRESSKTRESFTRGLSEKSIELLKEAFMLYPDFEQVFPPASIQKDRPMAASVLLGIAEQLRKIMGVDDWSIHDLRRTVKTKMGELGVLPHISEKILGHKLSGVLAVYDQHEYIKEQIEALNLWANHIQSCVYSASP